MGDFGTTARRLARNPLGIIALFIVLVYGFAALVAGPFGSHLSEQQKWLLLLFLVLFPLVVFFTFVYLVVKYHAKLYAPSDFRSDEPFMQIASPEEQAERLDREVLASYDEARTTVTQQAQSQQTDPKRLQNTKQLYILAEDLALRQLEAETNEPITRQVAFQIGESRLIFDGAIIRGNEITIIEVKYAQRLDLGIKLTRSLVNKISGLINYLRSSGQGASVKLLLILVTQQPIDEPNHRVDQLAHIVSDFGFATEVRLFDLDTLRKKFGVNEVN